MKLDVKLFGTPRILADNREIVLPYKKADAVLYYVLLKGSATRIRLSELLWPDAPVETGLKNLRHAIYSIRKALGWNPFCEQQRSTLTISPEVSVVCDALVFSSSGAIGLYSGDLLEGLSIPSADAFESWIQEERRQLQAQYLDLLLAAAQDALARGDLKTAEQCCLRYMQTDRTEENNVILLMRVYRAQHQFRKAIELYQAICKTLTDEYGISPLSETTELYYGILSEWNASVDEAADSSGCLLLGKDAALKRLLELCNGARRAPHSRCVLLEGEAGVGKTCLLDWVLKSYDLSDYLICRSTCYQTESERFLAPWNSVFFELISELEARDIPIPTQHAKAASALFPALPRDSGADASSEFGYPVQFNYETARQGALMLLSAVSRRIPILLIFEDIHWIDRSSAEMLSMLLRRIQNADISVICTCRDILPAHVIEFADLAERDKILERCRLQNFNREEARQYLRFYAPQTLSAEQEEKIFQSTSGNALLLSQVIGSLEDAKKLTTIASGMENIIGYRLASLSEDERHVLELVSVFIGLAPFEALSSILKKSVIEQTYLCCQLTQKKLLAEAAESGVLEYGFAHERIKAAVSEKLTVTARRMLCLRVAEYLQQKQDESCSPDQLVYYYEQGGDRLHALKYRIESLERDAGVYYELMPTLGGRVSVERQDDNRLVEYYGNLETQLASLRQSCLGSDEEELNRLERKLLHAQGCYYIHEGFYDKGLPALERLLRVSMDAGSREMALNAHRQYVYYGIQTCDKELMHRHIEHSAALVHSSDTPEYGVLLRLRGLLLLMHGKYEEARETFRKAIRTFRTLEDCVDGKYAIHIAGCYNYMAETYRLQGDYGSAFSHYDQAINYNRNRDYYPGAAVFYTNYGVAAWQAGLRDEALRMFRYAVQIYAGSHEYSAYPIALSYLAYYDVEDGCVEQAAERLQCALTLSRRIGSDWWTGITLYMTWKIRKFLEARGCVPPILSALWPVDEREHCELALRYLRKLQPRMETDEIEQALRGL
ncbi:MAG: AAA family ATPase [Oscillospiraceae bacterium]|nr:AAA family ATPase [Oscillospiraceae bacterium]